VNRKNIVKDSMMPRSLYGFRPINRWAEKDRKRHVPPEMWIEVLV